MSSICPRQAGRGYASVPAILERAATAALSQFNLHDPQKRLQRCEQDEEAEPQ
jgi:hypothetical protein